MRAELTFVLLTTIDLAFSEKLRMSISGLIKPFTVDILFGSDEKLRTFLLPTGKPNQSMAKTMFAN